MLNKNINRLVKLINDLDPISIFMVIFAIAITWYAFSHSYKEIDIKKEGDSMRGWKKPSQGDTVAKEIPVHPPDSLIW